MFYSLTSFSSSSSRSSHHLHLHLLSSHHLHLHLPSSHYLHLPLTFISYSSHYLLISFSKAKHILLLTWSCSCCYRYCVQDPFDSDSPAHRFVSLHRRVKHLGTQASKLRTISSSMAIMKVELLADRIFDLLAFFITLISFLKGWLEQDHRQRMLSSAKHPCHPDLPRVETELLKRDNIRSSSFCVSEFENEDHTYS